MARLVAFIMAVAACFFFVAFWVSRVELLEIKKDAVDSIAQRDPTIAIMKMDYAELKADRDDLEKEAKKQHDTIMNFRQQFKRIQTQERARFEETVVPQRNAPEN